MKVAITGGIAMGKSTVLAMIAESGYSVLSADEVARECFPEAEAEVAAVAGLSVPIDRTELLSVLAASDGIRRNVNKILHPRVIERLLASDAAFVEVPLLGLLRPRSPNRPSEGEIWTRRRYRADSLHTAPHFGKRGVCLGNHSNGRAY
jgi:Dephospho-CoA kinase